MKSAYLCQVWGDRRHEFQDTVKQMRQTFAKRREDVLGLMQFQRDDLRSSRRCVCPFINIQLRAWDDSKRFCNDPARICGMATAALPLVQVYVPFLCHRYSVDWAEWISLDGFGPRSTGLFLGDRPS